MFQQGIATVIARLLNDFFACRFGFRSPVQDKLGFGVIAVEIVAIFGQDTDAFNGDIQGVVNWNVVVSQQLQRMGFFGTVKAVQNDRFIAYFNHLPHLVGCIFFYQRQAFSKADAIAPKKSHNQKSSDVGVVQYDSGTIGKYRRIGVCAAGHIDRIRHGCRLR